MKIRSKITCIMPLENEGKVPFKIATKVTGVVGSWGQRCRGESYNSLAFY